MSEPTLHVLGATEAGRQPEGDSGWLSWLLAHLDPAWRPGEWDQQRWLFTGDLASDRTAAWPCRTPGCLTATRYHHGRCDGCRRARTEGVSWEDFDAAPPPRRTRPLQRGSCSVPDCAGELLCRGLCFRHERSWRKDTTEPLEAFTGRARPLARLSPCLVLGCDREHVSRRGLCWFHHNRLLRGHDVTALPAQELAAWIASEQPRLGVHQFYLAGLPELPRTEFSTHCNVVTRHRRRWNPPRCGFCSAA